MGGEREDQHGGGYARGNPYGAVASLHSPEQVAQESRHDPAFQARVRERMVQIDAMLDDSVGDALALVNNGNGNGSAPHNE